MFLGCNHNVRWAFQASMPRALLSSLSIWGTLEPSNRTRLSQRRKPCCLEQLKSPSLGKPPRHHESITPLVGHHGHKLQNERTSDTRPYLGAGDLESAAAHWNCHALGPEPNPTLCFQTSILTLLAQKTSRLGILEPQDRIPRAHQKEEVPYGAAQIPHMRINLHGPRPHPNFLGCPEH